MATQTFLHSSYGAGLVVVEFDVNNANWRVAQVRCRNNSTKRAAARIFQAGAEIFLAAAPAGQVTTWNTTGVQLGWDPVDGGIQWGNYVMQSWWPAE